MRTKTTLRRARIEVAEADEAEALAELKGASVGYSSNPEPLKTRMLQAAALAWVNAAEAVLKARAS